MTVPAINLHRPRPEAPSGPSAPAVPTGCVQIYCADPPRSLVVLLGPEPVKLTGGGGGWELVGRPHQTSMTIWQGGEPYALALSLMLDDYPAGDTRRARHAGAQPATPRRRRLRARHRRDRRGAAARRRMGNRVGRLRRPDPRARRHAAAAPARHARAARVRAPGVRAATPPRARQGEAQDEGHHRQKGRHGRRRSRAA